MTNDAQINVYSDWLRRGGEAVHYWQIRKFDRIKEVIKASYHLGIRSESLLEHWECTFRGDWIVVFCGFDSCDLPPMYQEPLQAQHCSL